MLFLLSEKFAHHIKKEITLHKLLSYIGLFHAPGAIRTHDPFLRREVSIQLSYEGNTQRYYPKSGGGCKGRVKFITSSTGP